MAAVNFPNPAATNPDTGAPYSAGWYNADNGVTYVYEGNAWKAATVNNANFDDIYVNEVGDNMTGNLTLGDGVDDKITLNAATGNAAFAGNAEVTGDVQMASQNGGPLAGFRNHLINGAVNVNQRNVVSGIDFTVDRWRAQTSTVTVISFPAGRFENQLRFDNGGQVQQLIELPRQSVRGQFAEGTTWTLSYYTTNTSPAFSPTIMFSEDSGAGANFLPQNISMTPTGESEGTLQRISGTVVLNSGSIGSALGLRVQIPGDANDTVTGFQFEPGPVATPFEHRPIGTELALCQRYYQSFIREFNGYVPNAPADNGQSYSRESIPLQSTVRVPVNSITLVDGQMKGLGYPDFTPVGLIVHTHPLPASFSVQYVAEGGNYYAEWIVDAEL